MAFKTILIQMNNATPHYTQRTQSHMESTEVVPECPYCLDLRICNKFFFLKFRNTADQRRRRDDDFHKALLQITKRK